MMVVLKTQMTYGFSGNCSWSNAQEAANAISNLTNKQGYYTGYVTDNFIKEELCNSRPVLVTVRLNMDPNNQTYHMMVLTGMDNNYVYVNDPWKSNGQSYVYSKASFDACFNSSGRIVTYFR